MSKEMINILFAMIGVIIGVLISIYPTQIEESRDKSNKLSNYWSLINYELTSINSTCNKLTKEIKILIESNQSTVVENLPDITWKTATNDADFLQSADKETFTKLDKIYQGINLLNNTAQSYSNFTTTSGALTTYHQILKAYHTNILNNLNIVIK